MALPEAVAAFHARTNRSDPSFRVTSSLAVGDMVPVANDGTGLRVRAIEREGHDGSRSDEVDQTAEERLLAVSRIVSLGQPAIDMHQLESDDLEAALLVARENSADQLALDAVGLDQDEGPFAGSHGHLVRDVLDVAGLYRIGLTGQAFVRVKSRRGEMIARALVTDRVSPGLVFGNFHFPGRQNVNNLTIAALDPVAKIPEYKVCAVRLETV